MTMTFTPFLDVAMVLPSLYSLNPLTLMLASKMSCTDATDDGKLLMQPGQSDENGNADAKADGPSNDGKMMPCPVAHMMLAKVRMPTAD